ncbi:hypothetical protein OG884_26510 [Streptosporangium sp. NBC_01755]|uniref:hypothetical protein n=1 Tax=Streptosporangium sp. NBC_01755 TaxID=2975949 RepID=UPI002DDAFAA3|nr:hypothetical protein [Streptosporangium sp. NBC_01755]WSC98402.1 hypothetical protein OG884_26510 [Streptosporangium sp. NBC_01755]
MPQRSSLKLNLGQLDKDMHEAAADGLQKWMEHNLKVSRDQVPHEEGTLERSGVASVDRTQLKGAVSFDTEYAIPQHEHLDWKHDDDRKAKYVEDPWDSEQQIGMELVATEMRRRLR